MSARSSRRAARDRILEWIERGIEGGATAVVDGRAPAAPGGAFVGPTILDDVTPDMDIAQEEVFGPVLSVIHAGSLDEAIEIVNSSRYGNGTSIFTESGAAARRYRHDVQVGMVGINIGVAAPVAFFPFSGWKGSFFGDLHAHGTDAVEFYTRKKTVTSRFFSGGETGRFFVEQAETEWPSSTGRCTTPAWTRSSIRGRSRSTASPSARRCGSPRT